MQFSVKNMSNIVTNTNNWRHLFPPTEQLNEITLLNAGFIPQQTDWHTSNCIQNFWVLWYNFSPGNACISGNSQYELTPDNIILIPPNTVYSGVFRKQVAHFYIWFKTAGGFEYPERKVLNIPAQPFFEKLHQAPHFTPKTKLLLFNLLSSILLDIPDEFFCSEQFKIKSRTIEKAINIIALHRGKINNAQIARELNISPVRFSHLFKNEMGISPQRYCLQIKMAVADQFLHLGWSIEDVATACGFADRYHFSKEFKKYQGISPGKWQKLFSQQKKTE